MRDLQRATRTTVKCGSVRVVNEDLSGMSLAEVGLALKSNLLAPRSEPATLVANFVLRHRDVKRHSPCATAAELSLSLETGRAQLDQDEGPERRLTSTFKKPASKHEHSWSLTRHWSRTSRLGRCRMNTKSPLLRCETCHLVPGHPLNTKLPDNRLHQVIWPRCHQN